MGSGDRGAIGRNAMVGVVQGNPFGDTRTRKVVTPATVLAATSSPVPLAQKIVGRSHQRFGGPMVLCRLPRVPGENGVRRRAGRAEDVRCLADRDRAEQSRAGRYLDDRSDL